MQRPLLYSTEEEIISKVKPCKPKETFSLCYLYIFMSTVDIFTLIKSLQTQKEDMLNYI